MKKIFKFALCAACFTAMVACNNNGGSSEVVSDKEAALKRAMTPYVENTVIATYRSMADEGLVLLEKVKEINTAVNDGKDYTQTMKEAGEAWRAMRKYWEQSEAFLYGPAAAHNIDPHIDTWPLDFTAMSNLLKNLDQMKDIEADGVAYVKNNLGPSLQGFHAAEYMLFESVEQGGRAVGTGNPHATNLSKAESAYLLGVVTDLVQQAILIEDSWAGEVSAAKEAIITEDDESMSYGENYGEYMVNAGQAGSLYKSYQHATEEIIDGCVNIADEVAGLKMGNPYLSSTDEERDYIESPYSCTSTRDFADNIRSIQHSYEGSQAGDFSISNYIYSQDPKVDAEVRKAIEEAIAAIEAIQNFESTAQNNPQVKAAMEAVEKVGGLLAKDVKAIIVK